MRADRQPSLKLAALLAGSLALAACTTTTSRGVLTCTLPQGPAVGRSIDQSKDALSRGCQHRFEEYYQRLLVIAEGDPSTDNKRRFSEFLLWSTDQGLISRRQAQRHYNRYFNVKFTSLMGDYNTCSQACPNGEHVLSNMEGELRDKERGLLKVAADPVSYYRAAQLYNEAELVLKATCLACEGGR